MTQPVVADGRLFVADKDAHLVHVLDVQTGNKLWSHVSGGRIDSPPTIAGDRVLFGSADGYVTCLRSGDGELVWRYRVAPVDLRTVSFDQIESVWPVHGSILVQNGVATVVAGRSMYLDGGLRVCRLDVATGRLLSEEIMDDQDPESGGSLQEHIKGLNMPVALTDILSSDGKHLFMRSQVMDRKAKRVKLGPDNTGFYHLFAPYGFTDHSWFHRAYWVYGDGFHGGVGGYGNGKKFPAGRILVNNDDTVFGYGRKPEFYRWTSVLDYQLFAAAKPGGSGSKVAYRWTRDVPILVRAMALAGDKLVIAGPADVLDELSSFQTFSDSATQKALAEQDAIFRGERGAMLQVVDAGSGETITEVELSSPPVFDGLIVAAGKVFLSTMNGQVAAFDAQGK